MNRRWAPSGPFRTGDGLEWRVVPGSKTPSDLVLEVRTASGWSMVKMQTGFLMADFLAENENVLRDEGYFPPTAVGGGKYLQYLRIAADEGWVVASDRLDGERVARRAREATPPLTPVMAPCRTVAPDGLELCGEPFDHLGPHKGESWIWPWERVA